MAYTKISYELKGDIAIISFNDPSTLNACGVDTAQELLHAFEVAADEARCTILTGAGRGFCSGANLGPGGLSVKLSHEGSKHPVITAVNGPAAGVGCSLALVGDIVVCAKSAYFLQAFRRIGLVPDGGSTWLLARTIGRVRAMEMALFGDKVPAEKAMEWGMINRIVEDDQLMPTALEMAEKLASGPTIALSLARELIWKACESDFDEAIYDERLAQRTAGRTDDFKEGVSAFLQKRPAEFKGK